MGLNEEDGGQRREMSHGKRCQLRMRVQLMPQRRRKWKLVQLSVRRERIRPEAGKLASDNSKLVSPFRQERRQTAKIQGGTPTETTEKEKAFSDFFMVKYQEE